jgi:hypothetical protein
MELLSGIDKPMPGERPLQVVPPLAPYVRPEANAGQLRRRLNLFPQRALTHVALTSEQRSRIIDTALLAQAVEPGVVDGFEVALESGRRSIRLLVSPGHALTIEGLDIELAYPLRVDPDALPLHGESLAAWTSDADAALRSRIANGDEIRLSDLLQISGDTRALVREGLLPHAMVLVAQPVSVAVGDAQDDVAACDNAADQVVTAELVWEDGFRLVWVPWPAERALPLWSQDGSTLDSRFRNRLAYAVFDDERRPLEVEGVRSVRRMIEPRTPDDPPPPRRRGEPPPSPVQRPWPWEALGVALSIVGFDAQFRAAFADRAAVVRQGGGRHNRAPLVRMAGDDVLWQARVAQMLEHVAELPEEERSAAQLVRHFERLPPTGLLPRAAVDFESKRQTFFPPTYDVQVQPVPIDMVDALMAESASLAPYNLSAADQVQVLVPVQARDFERDLLELDERIHPLFDLEIARLEDERLRLLRRRDALRRRIDLLSKAITGTLPTYPEDDPNALPDERGALDAMAFARVRNVQVVAANTVHWHGFTEAKGCLRLSEADALMVFVQVNAPVAALSLRVQLPNGAKAGVYWGARPVEAAPLMVCAGDLPTDEAGQPLTNYWLRLTAPLTLLNRNASGQPIANPLGGLLLDNLEFGILSAGSGVGVTWGYCGTVNAGFESYWVADAWPPGAKATGPAGLWGDDEGGLSETENNSWGVSLDAAGVTFVVDELKTLYETFDRAPGGLKREVGESWIRPAWQGRVPGRPQKTLASAFPPLIEQGLDALFERLGQRIAAADDHVEVGFLRARTDIFRLRQGVLGTAIASRLLTSPAAADLVQRSESSVTTDKVFADYFARARDVKPPSTA